MLYTINIISNDTAINADTNGCSMADNSTKSAAVVDIILANFDLLFFSI